MAIFPKWLLLLIYCNALGKSEKLKIVSIIGLVFEELNFSIIFINSILFPHEIPMSLEALYITLPIGNSAIPPDKTPIIPITAPVLEHLIDFSKVLLPPTSTTISTPFLLVISWTFFDQSISSL